MGDAIAYSIRIDGGQRVAALKFHVIDTYLAAWDANIFFSYCLSCRGKLFIFLFSRMYNKNRYFEAEGL